MGKLIGELLVEAKALTRDRLEEALKVPREPGKKIGQVLLERGWITEAQLTQALSFQLSVPWVSLYHIDFSRQLLSRVPREIAEKYCLMPIYVRHVKGSGDTLYVAIEDPTNQIAMNEVSKAAGLPARPMIASPADIRSAIRVYYGGDADGDAPASTHAPLSATNPERTASTPNAERKPEPPPLPKYRKTLPDGQPPPVAGAQALSAGPASQASPPKPPSKPAPSEPISTRNGARKSNLPPSTEAAETDGKMVGITLLDGTSLKLPSRPPRKRSEPAPTPSGFPEQLTTRDLISALRALSHGADVTEIVGDDVRWETLFAALLSLLLKKGIITDREFIEELRKG